jgi:hypothetical protein
MPHDDELCATHCQSEDCIHNATMYCNECDGILCISCAHSIHSEGRRKKHEIIHLEMCAQCGFQLATHLCRPCGDYYCDSCYKWIHRKGRLQLHTSAWVCDRCDICECRAAWYGHQDPTNNYKTTVYCRICFVSNFGYKNPLSYVNVFEVQYLGPAVHVTIYIFDYYVIMNIYL